MPKQSLEQRSLIVQQLVHNWVRPHWGLSETTPAMAQDYTIDLKMEEALGEDFFYHLLTDQCRYLLTNRLLCRMLLHNSC